MKNLYRVSNKLVMLLFVTMFLFIAQTASPVHASTTIAKTSVGNPWYSSSQRNVIYTGAYYVVTYVNNQIATGFTDIYAKTSTSLAGLTSATEQTITLYGDDTVWNRWNINVVSDTEFDLAFYSGSGNANNVRTCTIDMNGQIACGARASALGGIQSSGATMHNTTRGLGSNRIWLSSIVGGETPVWSADQTGGSGNITSFTYEGSIGRGLLQPLTVISLADTDSVMYIYTADKKGSQNDGVYSQIVTKGQGVTGVEYPILVCRTCAAEAKIGNAVRISDTDIRYVGVNGDRTTALQEFKWNGSGWSLVSSIDTSGNQSTPTIAFDSYNGNLYTFYVDGNTATPSIQRYVKALSGSWGSKTQVDAGEADANSLPITQLIQPTFGSTRCPGALVWAYQNINGTKSDLVVGSESLACN